jgi:hypothetical protein
MLAIPTVPLLMPDEERAILDLLRKACLSAAGPDFTDWPVSLYFRRTDRGLTPLAGHCVFVSTTVWCLLGGWIAQGELRYPPGQLTPHRWNVTANKTQVDLTGDQFPRGDGFRPPSLTRLFSVAYVAPPIGYSLIERGYYQVRWYAWVAALQSEQAFKEIFQRYPDLATPDRWPAV